MSVAAALSALSKKAKKAKTLSSSRAETTLEPESGKLELFFQHDPTATVAPYNLAASAEQACTLFYGEHADQVIYQKFPASLLFMYGDFMQPEEYIDKAIAYVHACVRLWKLRVASRGAVHQFHHCDRGSIMPVDPQMLVVAILRLAYDTTSDDSPCDKHYALQRALLEYVLLNGAYVPLCFRAPPSTLHFPSAFDHYFGCVVIDGHDGQFVDIDSVFLRLSKDIHLQAIHWDAYKHWASHDVQREVWDHALDAHALDASLFYGLHRDHKSMSALAAFGAIRTRHAFARRLGADVSVRTAVAVAAAAFFELPARVTGDEGDEVTLCIGEHAVTVDTLAGVVESICDFATEFAAMESSAHSLHHVADMLATRADRAFARVSVFWRNSARCGWIAACIRLSLMRR